MFQWVVRDENSGAWASVCYLWGVLLELPQFSGSVCKIILKILEMRISFDNSVLIRWVELLNSYSLFTHKILNLREVFHQATPFFYHWQPLENDLNVFQCIMNAESVEKAVLALCFFWGSRKGGLGEEFLLWGFFFFILWETWKKAFYRYHL